MFNTEEIQKPVEILAGTHRNFLRSYIQDLSALAARSLVNCHAMGVDSILFDDTPEARVRLFIANKHHTLHTNQSPFSQDMSVAIHPHHCAVRIQTIRGQGLVNIEASFNPDGELFTRYHYLSAITKGHGSFVKAGSFRLETTLQPMPVGLSLSLPPKRLHTMYLPKGESAAWLVMEGYEDSFYDSICYSTANLEQFDFAPMYQPMTVAVLEGHLTELGILIQ